MNYTKLLGMLFTGIFLSMGLQGQMYVDPKPYGGKFALKDLFEQELVYPPKAMEAGVEGTVEVVFTVTSSGITKNIQVLLPLEPQCDKEALRIASLVRWHPAERGGSPVATEHRLEVKFDRKKYRKYLKEREKLAPIPELAPASVENVLWRPEDLDTVPQPMIDRGMKGLSNYFSKNMKYPEEAFKRNVQGTVVMEFVIEKSGSITNIEAIKPLGGGCGEEAYRLVKGLRWIPAVKNGQSVRTLMRVDIEFRLVDPN